ncbi:hypothetical protein [Rubripirellula obstinata]|uniref:hypothetical protein n=1 Tax=Rubripirellula obstinata TaxID=406547 RepID=UPI00122CA619|nr:hypothetical protein [Rubripirellula obstinata]
MPQEQILQIGHPNEVMDTGVRYIGAAQINCLAAMKGANGPQVVVIRRKAAEINALNVGLHESSRMERECSTADRNPKTASTFCGCCYRPDATAFPSSQEANAKVIRN